VYTIKSTIDHYKGEIFRLNSENEKLREDLDALEQYGRREGVGLLSRRFLFTTGVEVS
jgi:argininosuccinate synthase